MSDLPSKFRSRGSGTHAGQRDPTDGGFRDLHNGMAITLYAADPRS